MKKRAGANSSQKSKRGARKVPQSQPRIVPPKWIANGRGDLQEPVFALPPPSGLGSGGVVCAVWLRGAGGGQEGRCDCLVCPINSRLREILFDLKP